MLLRVEKLDEIDMKKFTRKAEINEKVKRNVITIVENVKKQGLKGILKYYAKKFGDKRVNKKNIRASENEIKEAYNKINKTQFFAIKSAIKRIKVFALKQKKTIKDIYAKNKEGKVELRWLPIERVGIYAPAGKAPLPSSVLMAAIPAIIAGCKEFVICSPPQKNGNADPAVLVAANECGIKEIYKIGGAQAIAAMSYGCELFKPVQIISGPGNVYTTYAKQLISGEGTVKIDTIAGPSEIAIISDETGDAKQISLDMLGQAEHGTNSSAVCITTSEKLANKIAEELEIQFNVLPNNEDVRTSILNYGAILIAKNMEDVIKFVNEYVPEHVEIFANNPEQIANRITNAGAIFIGTAEVFGDYGMSGSNHILPTGSTAKFASGVSIYTFMKYQYIEQLTINAQKKLAKITAEFARLEKLEAHARAAEKRGE